MGNARVDLNGSDDYRRPVVSAGVPVACPMARSETVYSGHPRTRQIVSELQIPWSAEHDKPVPKLIVRVRFPSPALGKNGRSERYVPVSARLAGEL